MITVGFRFPSSRGLFFFFQHPSSVSFVREMHARNKYRALEKCVASIHHYADWYAINSHTSSSAGAAISLIARFHPLRVCAILFRGSWHATPAPRTEGTWFPSIEFYRRWKYWKHFRLTALRRKHPASIVCFELRAYLAIRIFFALYRFHVYHSSFIGFVYFPPWCVDLWALDALTVSGYWKNVMCCKIKITMPYVLIRECIKKTTICKLI